MVGNFPISSSVRLCKDSPGGARLTGLLISILGARHRPRVVPPLSKLVKRRHRAKALEIDWHPSIGTLALDTHGTPLAGGHARKDKHLTAGSSVLPAIKQISKGSGCNQPASNPEKHFHSSLKSGPRKSILGAWLLLTRRHLVIVREEQQGLSGSQGRGGSREFRPSEELTIPFPA